MLNQNIESEVMSVFKKVSPSNINIETDTLKQQKMRQTCKELFQYRLRLPTQFFNGKSVVDFGCGTGEIEMFLGEWGARVKGIDLNEESITRAKTLANQFNLTDKLDFAVGNVLTDIPEGIFDFVMSLGVIPHVADPQQLLDNMVSCTPINGILVLGYIEQAGMVQRWFHREIINAISGKDEKEIEHLAMTLFGDHIQRSVDRGGRSAKSIIFDYLVNPHYQALRLPDLVSYFEQKGFRYYSSWPIADWPFCMNSTATEQLSLVNEAYDAFSAILELRWLFAQSEDEDFYSGLGFNSPNAHSFAQNTRSLVDMLEATLNENEDIDVDKYQNLLEHIQQDASICLNTFKENISKMLAGSFQDLENALRLLSQLRSNPEYDRLPEFEHFFRGYNGLGTSYVAFINEGL
jgi:2-polyprenyl-3-methyl-5-hydroxy-6-metoxy-1,4-benzoquinol methylase